MTTKEYLLQLQTLDVKIQHKCEEAAQLRSIVLGHGMEINDMRVQTSPRNSQEDAITKYVSLEEKIGGMIDRYIDQKDVVINQIHELKDPRHMRILYDHYVPDERHKVKSLEQISVDMSYNYTYTCELHGQALMAFSEIIRDVISGH